MKPTQTYGASGRLVLAVRCPPVVLLADQPGQAAAGNIRFGGVGFVDSLNRYCIEMFEKALYGKNILPRFDAVAQRNLWGVDRPQCLGV